MSDYVPVPDEGGFDHQHFEVIADPKRPYKAYVATILSAVSVFVSYWIADTDPFTMKEAGEAALLALAASGLTGAGTYRITNPQITVSRPPPG